MTDKQFYFCVNETYNYDDRDTYISDIALSSIWGDDADGDIPNDRIASVGQIWDAVHRSVKQIADDAGISQRKLAERFCIPYKTVEGWTSNKKCAIYFRLAMQECLGLLRR